MGKSKGPRVKSPPKQIEKSAFEATGESMPPHTSQRNETSSAGKWRRLYRLLLRLGKIASAISAIGAFILLAAPQVRVLPSVVTDPQNTFGTQLAIVNLGRVPVFDLSFSCNVVNAQVAGGGPAMNNVSVTGPSIGNLWPNQTATRNCSIAMDSPNTSVYAIIKYRWPIYFFTGEASFYFTARRGSAGYFLVPDVRN